MNMIYYIKQKCQRRLLSDGLEGGGGHDTFKKPINWI